MIWISSALSEILIMIISIFAFTFFIGGLFVLETPVVKAETSQSFVPQGCCLESKEGAVCLNMNQLDSDQCKSNLLSTNCNAISDCQIGCCYDADGGSCSLNSPKKKCLENNGSWDSNSQCNIPQCQLGCCVIGDQASIKTSRECSKMSQELEVDNNFKITDSDGTCNSLTSLNEKGACITPATDYSGINDCKFTIKNSCKNGDFYSGFLCTSKELNTRCKPSKNTTCLEGKDQVFYTDTCGNPANIYDSTKYNDDNYWETVIAASASCSVSSSGSKNCGNCDYMTGNMCSPSVSGRDVKPVYGNNVCRDLSCINGKKHGESCCIYDF